MFTILGSHSKMYCLTAVELFLNGCFSDTVFVTLFRTAVETAVNKVHKLLRTGGEVPHLLGVVFLLVADGLFSLNGSERLDELFISTLSYPPPFFPSLVSLIVSVNVKHHVYLLHGVIHK